MKPETRNSKLETFLLFALLATFCANSEAALFTWDPSPTPGVTYRLYYGAAPHIYDGSFRTGTTNKNIRLPAGRYYLSVTALNSAGGESPYSDEITMTFADPVIITTATVEISPSVNFSNPSPVVIRQFAITNATLSATDTPLPALFIRARLDTRITDH